MDVTNGKVDDTAVTSNGDALEILTAVAEIIPEFTEKRHGIIIMIEEAHYRELGFLNNGLENFGHK